MDEPSVKAHFIEKMLLLKADSLSEGSEWAYELKLDGNRGLALKSAGRVSIPSRNNKDLSFNYPAVASALSTLPNDTVLDGELVALDDSGRPSFNACRMPPAPPF